MDLRMRSRVTRRGLLAGAASAWAGVAVAQGTTRPRLRAVRGGALAVAPLSPQARRGTADLVRAAGLDGLASIALVDLADGSLLDSYNSGQRMPPASVAKALTALYALDALGSDHRFATRLLATGPVVEGRVEGDLILAGGGDPVLTTDRMAELVQALAQAGVTGARGFRAWGGAIPYAHEIAADQLAHLGYNPSIGGLNLNFNRVHFEWARGGSGYRVTLDARGDEFRPAVTTASMRVEPRDLPVYTYAQEGEVDAWTVAEAALGDAGSRWLPVRDPALYAAQAFAGMARGMGVTLPEASVIVDLPPETTEIARIESEPLEVLVRDMLLYSTNLTAEVLGLAASLARGLTPASPHDSARAMNDWIAETTDARVRLVDHSGLGGESRVSALEMAVALSAGGSAQRIRTLMRPIPLTDLDGEPLAEPPALVRAKTGTLNFASSLAGYVRTIGGRDLVFAIFAADPARREAAAAASDEELPPGGREWTARARRLQQELLQRWGVLYA